MLRLRAGVFSPASSPKERSELHSKAYLDLNQLGLSGGLFCLFFFFSYFSTDAAIIKALEGLKENETIFDGVRQPLGHDNSNTHLHTYGYKTLPLNLAKTPARTSKQSNQVWLS